MRSRRFVRTFRAIAYGRRNRVPPFPICRRSECCKARSQHGRSGLLLNGQFRRRGCLLRRLRQSRSFLVRFPGRFFVRARGIPTASLRRLRGVPFFSMKVPVLPVTSAECQNHVPQGICSASRCRRSRLRRFAGCRGCAGLSTTKSPKALTILPLLNGSALPSLASRHTWFR